MKLSRTTVVALLVVITAVGLIWALVGNRQRASAPQPHAQTTECSGDASLCTFFKAHKARTSYTVKSLSQSGGQNTSMTMKVDGSNTQLTLTGSITYNVIGIGDVTYTQTPDGTWWKLTTPNSTLSQFKQNAMPPLAEPTASNTKDATYKSLGKEACGTLQCFKYQLTSAASPDVTTILWFDDSQHALQRTLTTTSKSSYDATYDFMPVHITEPTPTKELPPGQFVGPNQDQPLSMQ